MLSHPNAAGSHHSSPLPPAGPHYCTTANRGHGNRKPAGDRHDHQIPGDTRYSHIKHGGSGERARRVDGGWGDGP